MQSSVAIRMFSISGHSIFTRCIFQVVVFPWKIMKQYLCSQLLWMIYFFVIFCNYYFNRWISHIQGSMAAREKIGDQKGRQEKKPQGKDKRYSIFCRTVIFCTLNKIQLVSVSSFGYSLNFFDESCLFFYLSNIFIILCIIIEQANLCFNSSLLNYCVNYVLNKCLYLIHILPIETNK